MRANTARNATSFHLLQSNIIDTTAHKPFATETPRMRIKSLIPMLESNDLPATILFYTQLLDFKLNGSFEEDHKPVWASFINEDGVELMFKAPNTVMNYGTILLTGNLYLQSNNAQAWWLRLKDQVEIVYPFESFDYGMQEFGFKDNNGYVISIGSENENQ